MSILHSLSAENGKVKVVDGENILHFNYIVSSSQKVGGCILHHEVLGISPGCVLPLWTPGPEPPAASRSVCTG